MVQYVAMTDGCVGTHYVRAGELFEMEGAPPRWARRVPAADAASKVPRQSRPAGSKVPAARKEEKK